MPGQLSRSAGVVISQDGDDGLGASTVAKFGVFCLEGEWSSSLTDRSSVRPLLELLHTRGTIKYIHRDVATVDELDHLAARWPQKQYSDYRLGYFAFHGSEGRINVGRHSVDLDHLGALLADRLTDKIVYFGSCSTAGIGEDALRQFKKTTRARAVCGYTEDVDWLEAAAFELLLIDSVAYYTKRIDSPFKWLETNHGQMCDNLGFVPLWK